MYQDLLSPMDFVSIDGGTSTVGVCLFRMKEDTMVLLESRLLDFHHNEDRIVDLSERVDETAVRLRYLIMQLDKFIPSSCQAIFYESHFINPRRPTSVIPLAKFQGLVEQLALRRGIYFDTVAPQQMKSTIGISRELAKADKHAVRNQIMSLLQQGRIESCYRLDLLSEHEIDAIGIGYTMMVRSQLLTPCQRK